MQSNKAEAPKPCPFCGHENIETDCDAKLEWEKCMTCGATGPKTYKRHGRSSWNLRLGENSDDKKRLDFLDTWLKRMYKSTSGWKFYTASLIGDAKGLVPAYSRVKLDARQAIDEAAKDFPTEET